MINGKKHIQAFIAISLPENVKVFLDDLQGQLRKSGIKASWPKPVTMHLTLKFFGNLNADKVGDIKACMGKAVTGIPVHSLFASGIGVFPSVKNTRIIWSGTRGQTDILEKLVDRLEHSLFKNMGIKKENRRFSPHLTMARIKQPIHPKIAIKLLQKFEKFHSNDFVVSDIKFFQSKLLSSGAIHKNLFSIPFIN